MVAFEKRVVRPSPIVLAAQLFCLIVVTQATSVLEAYRLVQYDLDGVSSGSRTARLAQYATLKKEGALLFRNAVLLPFKEATVSIVSELLDPTFGVAGLMFILPDESLLTESDLEAFLELEKYLISNPITIPVYFVHDSTHLQELIVIIQKSIETGKAPSRMNGGPMLQIKSGVAKPIKNPTVINFEGILNGTKRSAPGKTATPTVVISAHYDDFLAAPALSNGGNGSGVVVLLTLMRLFKSLYQNPSTRPSFNLLFLLTGGGGLDFMGLKDWLSTADTRTLNSIDFVISLDELSGLLTEGNLYLHYSKPTKDPHAQKWYTRFEEAAKQEGVSLTKVHKKINLASPYMAWEHEHVAQNKLIGATLSGRREADNPMTRSSILDRSEIVNRDVVIKAVRILCNVLASRMEEDEASTNLKSNPFFANLTHSLPGAGEGFLRKWLNTMVQAPRMAPYLHLDDSLSKILLRFLKEHTDNSRYTIVRMEPEYVFYDSMVFKMSIFQAAGVLFDLELLMGVSLYLCVLFVALKIVTQGWDAFRSLFEPSYQKAKRKGNSRHKIQENIMPRKTAWSS